MKTRFILFVILVTVCLFPSCTGNRVISQEQYMEYAEEIGFLLPDSLRTPEQDAIRDKMVKIALLNTEVKNNKMRLKIKRDHFVEQGLPGFCYDMIQFDYANNNKMFDEVSKTTGISVDVEQLFKEAKEEYLDAE